MLVLSRKLKQAIIMSGGIRITVVGIRGTQVRLGIEAPDSVGIMREELCEGAAPEPTSANSSTATPAAACVAAGTHTAHGTDRGLSRRDEGARADWSVSKMRARPVRIRH